MYLSAITMYLSAIFSPFYVPECNDYVPECNFTLFISSTAYINKGLEQKTKKRKILEEYLRYSKRDNFFLTVKLSLK